ncbi:ABC transporter related protein [Coriobacterium glomerans PW2]|uniref:ABC transporter related protein n=1 Tax=Coriobacterium glomerans (strain ATCC 49209 / DSM 20642 / JCM 10262 / PW2) TaxID=700015 RepID=F2N7R2_CORGP|nr:ATP-binding cassette domain-containing protein [Coriobacterium glomerans]AEB06954.1 ABC transporter related protein [Coriobacterium glomerans PW2]
MDEATDEAEERTRGKLDEITRLCLDSLGEGTWAIVLWLLVWQLASFLIGSSLILAGPFQVLVALLRLLPTAAFWSIIASSGARILTGCLIGYLVALTLAALAYRAHTVRELLQPAMSVAKGTPIVCVIVVLLIWFGSESVSSISVFLLVLPAIYFSVLEGLDRLDPAMRELFFVFRIRGLQRQLAYVWPGVLPYLVATSETAISMSWKAGIAAELIGVPAGTIGERIYQSKILLETPDLFAWTAAVVLMAWACERAFITLLRHSAPASIRLAARLRPNRVAEPPGEIQARDLLIGYGETAVACAPSFELPAPEILCLSAPSGSGKTTLLKTIAGIIEPLDGNIEAPASMSMEFQDARLIDELSCVDNVLLVSARDLTRDEVCGLIEEILPEQVADAAAGELSGGQQRRLELVRALAAPSSVVLLDEPFAGLDDAARTAALDYIDRHLEGRTLIIATHDVRDADELGALVLSIAGA